MLRAILATTAFVTGTTIAQAEELTASVVEIATFQLAEGVAVREFAAADARIEAEHVSRQPGFVSRETGMTDSGSVAVIVYWASAEDAQASMDSFADAPAAAEFMGMLDVSTMAMTRYDLIQ